MPEGILKFKLPEEQVDFKRAAKAIDIALCLWDLKEHLRWKLKYDTEITPKEALALSEVREKLNDIMEYYGVDFDSILE